MICIGTLPRKGGKKAIESLVTERRRNDPGDTLAESTVPQILTNHLEKTGMKFPALANTAMIELMDLIHPRQRGYVKVVESRKGRGIIRGGVEVGVLIMIVAVAAVVAGTGTAATLPRLNRMIRPNGLVGRSGILMAIVLDGSKAAKAGLLHQAVSTTTIPQPDGGAQVAIRVGKSVDERKSVTSKKMKRKLTRTRTKTHNCIIRYLEVVVQSK